MTSPELQNYISQSRAAGMNDTQIRQNLITQGWPPNVVDEAITGKTSSSNNNSNVLKIIIIVLLLLFALPIIGWLIFAGIFFHKIKDTIPNNNPTTTNKTTIKVPFTCDNPNLTAFNFGYGQLGTTLPDTWPKDIPQYPGSKFIGATNMTFDQNSAEYGYALYCTKDSVQKVSNYFVTNGSTYKLKIDDTSNQTQGSSASQQILSGNGNSGGLMISVGKQENGDTAILTTFEGNNPKK